MNLLNLAEELKAKIRALASVPRGRLRSMLKSNVLKIEPGSVIVECDGRPTRLDNDFVIVSAGGILPTAFLASLGIDVETKHGTA